MIDASTVNWVLAAAYALIALIASVQLIRIQVRVPEYGWTTQKVFHLLNLLVAVLRAGVFALRPAIEHLSTSTSLRHVELFLKAAVMDVPGLLFFTTYTLLVLFWAEIYHQAKNLPTNMLKPGFLGIHVFVYALQVGLLLLDAFSNDAGGRSVARTLSGVSLAAVSALAAVGFIMYGGRLFLMLRRFPIESRGRHKKLREVGLITTICTLCFALRSAMLIVSVTNRKTAELDVMAHPATNLLYYSVSELLPTALVLFTLRKLPPKRPQGYHSLS